MIVLSLNDADSESEFRNYQHRITCQDYIQTASQNKNFQGLEASFESVSQQIKFKVGAGAVVTTSAP